MVLVLENTPANLEEEVAKMRNSLSTDRLDMSFGEIIGTYEREEIIIDPEFQRLFRWKNEQQTRFIESLLLGIPIPPIFVAENQDGKWELVDGLQRLSTVLSFFGKLKNGSEKNHWKLGEGDLIKSFKDLMSSQLSLRLQLNIKRAVCRVEIIRWNSAMDMRYELFNRLNTGGSPLTEQEIRNCVFRGLSSQFNHFLKEISQINDFLDLINPTDKQKSELYVEELVLRFVSLYDNENNIKKNISEHMTLFMGNAVKDKEFDYDGYRELINRLIQVFLPLGSEVFRGKNGSFSTSYFESIMIGVAKNIQFYENNKTDVLSQKITQLKNSSEFQQHMGPSSNNKTRIIGRIKTAQNIFQQ